jgi:ATP-dependent exoDNAse (exonuclease V) beta subunit
MGVSTMSGGRIWTPEQAEAIERREGDLLLEAGAGSGKTSVLVERFARYVLEDGIGVSAILAITFTEKAAAELRDRIRSRLAEAGESELARATEEASISTIHGFCARLLRAHALAAGLDPGFVVLDRNQSGPLAAAAFDEALSALERDDAVELVSAYGAWALQRTILPVYAQLRSSGQVAPRLPDLPPPPRTGPERLARAIETAVAELGEVTAPGAQVVRALERLGRCRELVEVAELWPAELDSVKLPGSGAALSTDACTEYREALGEFRAACAARAAGPLRDRLDRLLRGFGERYAARKREVSGLDFEDLELEALGLLRERPELRERYAARFERIMVDELQDTNRVQLELIETIARENLFTVGDAQQSIYRFRHADVSLFEHRGARLAELDARRTLQTNFRSRPEILETLNHGFATELGEHFTPLEAGRESSEEMPESARVELLLVDKGADWELEGQAAPWRLAEAQALAARVAELVRAGTPPGEVVILMRATADMRVYERALEQLGLPTYVIGGRGYWSHPQIVDLVACLRALANPLEDESLYTVLASPLVGVSLDALVILAAAARTVETSPWQVLRTPDAPGLERLGPDDRQMLSRFTDWFGRERAELAHHPIEELIERLLGLTGYDLAMLAMPGGRRRLANVRKLMRLGREYEREHGPDLRGFLTAIADRASGLALDSRESEAPVEGEGLDAVRLMTIHRAKGLEWPTVCVADLGRTPRPPSPVVRISSDGRLGLRLSRAGAGDRVSTPEYEALYREERDAEAEEERRLFYVAMTRAQERLILSGAARFDGWTGVSNSTGGGPVAWIAPALVSELGQVIGEGGGVVEAGRGQLAVHVAAPDELAKDVAPKNLAEAGEAPGSSPGGGSSDPRQARLSRTTAPSAPVASGPPVSASSVSASSVSASSVSASSVSASPVSTLSYSSLALYERCGYRFYSERVLGLPLAPPSVPKGPAESLPGPGRLSAAERGVLLHALLERISFRRPVAPAGAAVMAAARGAGLPAPAEEEVTQLAAQVARFAASEVCARLGGALETRREQPFAFPLGELLVTGVLDVLAREPERLLVVDYKSDRLEDDPAVVVERDYGTQQLVYALAALHAGAEQVQVVHCFLQAPDSPVMAEFGRSDAERLGGALQRLASGLQRGEFAVTHDPQRSVCAGCPAEGGLCSWPLPMTRRSAVDRLF